MKPLSAFTISLTAIGLCSVPASAAPLLSFGDDAALFINSSAAVEYNTNVFRQSGAEEDDTAFVIRPGLELTYGGQGAPASAVLQLGWEFREQLDIHELDGNFAKINFDTTYDSGVSLFTGHASFNEYGTSSRDRDPEDSAAGFVPVIAERAETRLGGDMKYRISERLAFGGGLSFFGRTYDNNLGGRRLVDLDQFELPLRVFYNIAPELDLVAGYRYRVVNVGDQPDLADGEDRAPDYADNYYFIGLDGQLFNPLWHVAFDIGLQEREYQNSPLDTIDSISASGRITYAASATRSYYLLLSRDYTVSPVRAETYLRNQITIGGNYLINEMWSAVVAANYAMSDYDTYNREEDLFFVLGGLTYSPNEYVSFSGRVRLTTVDGSGERATNYDDEFFSVSASVRY